MQALDGQAAQTDAPPDPLRGRAFSIPPALDALRRVIDL
jgi:hypothetical protein